MAVLGAPGRKIEGQVVEYLAITPQKKASDAQHEIRIAQEAVPLDPFMEPTLLQNMTTRMSIEAAAPRP
jgi:hypothetical protein